MSQIELVYELLKTDLTAPRTLLVQVADAIAERRADADLQAFFTDEFPKLEDYEIDLIFSPQYTPAEHNRLDYIPILGARALSAEEVGALKRRLTDAGLTAVFRSPDELSEATAPLHEVFIDRYVGLLKLDQPLPTGMYDEIVLNVPEPSRNLVNLLARDDVWRGEGRRNILIAFLRAFKARDSFSTPKVAFLTNFVRTYRPASLLDMERQLESLIESCKTDMENVQGRGFHDEYLKAMNAGNDLTKATEHGAWEHYHQMMDMAQQLIEDYRHIPQAAPDLMEKARQQQPV